MKQKTERERERERWEARGELASEQKSRVCIISVLDADERTIFMHYIWSQKKKNGWAERNRERKSWKPSPKRCVNHHNNGGEYMKTLEIYIMVDFCEGDHIIVSRCTPCNHFQWVCVHLVKHSAGVVTPNKNGTHFHFKLECCAHRHLVWVIGFSDPSIRLEMQTFLDFQSAHSLVLLYLSVSQHRHTLCCLFRFS